MPVKYKNLFTQIGCLVLSILSCASTHIIYKSGKDVVGIGSLFLDTMRSLNSWGIGSFLLVVGLFFLYKKVLGQKVDYNLLAFSTFLAMLMIVGLCYQNSIGSIINIFAPAYILKSIIVFIGYSFIFYVALRLLFDCINKSISEKVLLEKHENIRFISLKRLLIILLCWVPYMIVLFPGTILSDTTSQILQFFGDRILTNDSPFFQTLLIGLFVKLGCYIGSPTLGVFLYVLTQLLFFASILVYMWNVLEKYGLPKRFTHIILLSYCLFPIYPLYGIAVGKDINFGIAILWLDVMMFEIIQNDTEFFKDARKIIVLTLDLLLICILRNAGVFLSIACIGAILFISTKQWKKILLISLVVLILNILWSRLLLPIFHVVPARGEQNKSIILQQTARYVIFYEDEVTEKEKQTINKILDYEKLKTAYKPEISDPVKVLYNQEATQEQLNEYYTVWLKQFFKHPLCYIDATLNNSYGYFYPDDIGKEKAYVFVGITDKDKQRLSDIGIEIKYLFPQIANYIRKSFNPLRQIPLLGSMLSTGFYSWCLFIFTYATARSKKER